MAQFTYRARRPTGEIVQGQRDASSAAELQSQLARDGLFLVDSATSRGTWMPRFGLPRRRARTVRLSALISFVRELRVLVGAGLPMVQILTLLAERDDDAALAEAIRDTRAGIEKGLALDEAAARQPEAFDGMMLATLAAGVRTGRLEDALARLEIFLALQAELQRKVRKALSYPLFLMALLVAVIIVLMLFVLPRFSELYAEFGSDLPVATQVLMTMTRTAPLWVPAGAAGIVALGWLIRAAMRRPGVRLAVQKRIMRLPVLGPILLDISLVQGCYLLAMLLGAGMPLRDALGFLSGSGGNPWMQEQFARIRNDIDSGRSLSAAAAETRLFPPSSAGMLRAGDLSGDLPEMLLAITRMHEQTLDERMSRLLALIEPAMMLIVGGVLGAVIIAVYLPIFGISSVVR